MIIKEVQKVREQPFSMLGDDMTHYSKKHLIYHALKLIEPVNKRLELIDESIEKTCGIVNNRKLKANAEIVSIRVNPKEKPFGLLEPKQTSSIKYGSALLSV